MFLQKCKIIYPTILNWNSYIYLPYSILICKTVQLIRKPSSAKSSHDRWSRPMMTLYPHSLALVCMLQFFYIFFRYFFGILNIFSSNVWPNIFCWWIERNNRVFVLFDIWSKIHILNKYSFQTAYMVQ